MDECNGHEAFPFPNMDSMRFNSNSDKYSLGSTYGNIWEEGFVDPNPSFSVSL